MGNVNLTSHRAKSIYGVLLIILGIVTIALAIVFSPTFAARYFSADHELAPSTIRQFNDFRYIFAFVGILMIVSGSILMTVKDLGAKVQKKLSIFHLKNAAEKESRKTSLVYGYIFLGTIVITGFVLLLWMTPFGAGAWDDSVSFIAVARSLLSGNGYSIFGHPFTDKPPLYPIFLVATGLFVPNLLQAARFLNAILFGVNLGLFGLAIYLTTGRRILTTACAVLFFLSSASLLEFHYFAMSEPLFYAFSLACIILLSFYVMRPILLLAIASCLCLGLALATRWIGIGFLPAAFVIVFIAARGQKTGRKIRDALIWVVLASAPLAFWSVRNKLVAGMPTEHLIYGWHPVNVFSYVGQIISRGFDFIAPVLLPGWVKLAIFGLVTASLLAIFIILFKRYIRDYKFVEIPWPSMGFIVPLICLLFSVSYLIFFFISISFFERTTPTDMRILSTILIIMTVGVFSAIWTISKILNKPILWWCFLIFIVLFIAIRTPDAIRTAENIQKNGLDYTSKQWRDSELIAFTRSLGENVKIYTPNFELIDFWIETGATPAPQKFFSDSTNENPIYNQEMEAMCKDIRENGALFVYVTVPYESIQVAWNGDLVVMKDGLISSPDASNPTEDASVTFPAEIESTCHLPVLRAFADGIVYGKK